MTQQEDGIQYVQITIRLGSQQSVKIQADKRVTFGRDPKHVLHFERTGAAFSGDINQLVDEVLKKLRQAFGKEQEIELCVDGDEIVACP